MCACTLGEESSRKSCVNGVACAGILESFVVDGISFKVVTEGAVNSLEKITLGFLLILSPLKLQNYGFYGQGGPLWRSVGLLFIR